MYHWDTFLCNGKVGGWSASWYNWGGADNTILGIYPKNSNLPTDIFKGTKVLILRGERQSSIKQVFILKNNTNKRPVNTYRQLRRGAKEGLPMGKWATGSEVSRRESHRNHTCTHTCTCRILPGINKTAHRKGTPPPPGDTNTYHLRISASEKKKGTKKN